MTYEYIPYIGCLVLAGTTVWGVSRAIYWKARQAKAEAEGFKLLGELNGTRDDRDEWRRLARQAAQVWRTAVEANVAPYNEAYLNFMALVAIPQQPAPTPRKTAGKAKAAKPRKAKA